MKNRIGFDTTILGREVCIEFTRRTKFGRELYGSDADGRRGMRIDTIDRDEAELITLLEDDGDIPTGQSVLCPGQPLLNRAKLEDLPQELQDVVTTAVETYMEENEPEGEVDETEPEPDYDDHDAWDGGFADNN